MWLLACTLRMWPDPFRQATVTAAAVVTVMVVLYGGGLLRSTSSVVKVIAGAAGGVGCAYAVGFAAKAFGVDFTFLGQTDLVGAAGSVLAAGLAASNLFSVFRAIELSAERGLTKMSSGPVPLGCYSRRRWPTSKRTAWW